MRKHALIIGAAFVVMVAVGPGMSQGPAPKGKSAEESFTGKAIAVHFKTQQRILLLEDPQIRTFGGQHSFLIGQVPTRTMKIWVPLADVAKVEEFKDINELAKTYRLDNAPAKAP